MESIISSVEVVVREQMGEEKPNGHDWWHADRVRRLALRIANTEPTADRLIVEIAALMHDLEDHKFGGLDEEIPLTTARVLRPLGVVQPTIDRISEAIRTVSFKGAAVATTPRSIEGKIVQDADRLDAMGAIGIARTFIVGAAVFGRPMFVPDVRPTEHQSFEAYRKHQSHTINHFHEKLLLLKDRMNTKEGSRLAKDRHQYLVDFLAQFHAEWKDER